MVKKRIQLTTNLGDEVIIAEIKAIVDANETTQVAFLEEALAHVINNPFVKEQVIKAAIARTRESTGNRWVQVYKNENIRLRKQLEEAQSIIEHRKMRGRII